MATTYASMSLAAALVGDRGDEGTTMRFEIDETASEFPTGGRRGACLLEFEFGGGPGRRRPRRRPRQ